MSLSDTSPSGAAKKQDSPPRAGTSAQKWVWHAFAKSALVPLVLVETVLIAVYLLTNATIRDANIDYLRTQADHELTVSA
ncbi:hypothetical protein SAMN05421831_10444 [Allopseudospirillum japonicum]|uniref:Uncharacterized protein n=1 Tax=Allopseudospirillum japonicum TaxID=64971 RepID=A0A1H6RKB2_9GAMM|nr:hypothetical protein [Allopseudospirillum japonicum]SEI54926.1 hypothetical protein SAMN05421831_10444 [Allopseudospirillum japonicum]